MNPYELFLIFSELVAGMEDPALSTDFAFMIDEMPVIKPRIESMIQSAVNLQEAYAKALLIRTSGYYRSILEKRSLPPVKAPRKKLRV